MRSFSGWSLNLGRWVGIQVRLHAFFLLFGVFTLYLSTLSSGDAMITVGYISLGILLLSVIAHEVGHCLVAVRLGGTVEQVVIGPLGGLAPVNLHNEPRLEALAALAGPVVNLAIFLSSALLLVLLDEDLGGLLSLLQPRGLTEAPHMGIVALKLSCWLNWVLFWVNMLPAFPMDGGPALRAWLTPMLGYRSAVVFVARAAVVTALAICVYAWLVHDARSSALVPLWVPLVMFAMFLFFSAQQEVERLSDPQTEEELLGYDFSQGYTSLERQFDQAGRSGVSGMRRWIEARKEARQRRVREVEQDEERRVDEILERLHAGGMNALTAEERAILNRVSTRYRNRQSN